MRYELHDTVGTIRSITVGLDIDDLRSYISEFKTHCAIDNSAYEYNHFVNWLKKNYNIKISFYQSERVDRVDM
jgi:hypothetical protein